MNQKAKPTTLMVYCCLQGTLILASNHNKIIKSYLDPNSLSFYKHGLSNMLESHLIVWYDYKIFTSMLHVYYLNLLSSQGRISNVCSFAYGPVSRMRLGPRASFRVRQPPLGLPNAHC